MIPLSRLVHRKARLVISANPPTRKITKAQVARGRPRPAAIQDGKEVLGSRTVLEKGPTLNEASANQPEIDSVSTDEDRANGAEV